MKKKDIKALVGKNMNELQAMLAKERKELFTMKLDNSQRKLKNTRSIFSKRKEIARIFTAKREMELKHA